MASSSCEVVPADGNEEVMSFEEPPARLQDIECEVMSDDGDAPPPGRIGTPPVIESPLLLLPHDVCTNVIRGLAPKAVGALAACCRIMSEVIGEGELWFELFMHVCWPPSAALAAFAEDGTACPSSIDWRARLKARASMSPAIVVDSGYGYTKYGIVHGLDGRPEGDGVPPTLVQLCSSPTHPPDCDRDGELRYIHHEIDKRLLHAAINPQDPYHHIALCESIPLVSHSIAVLRGFEEQPDYNGCIVLLQSFDEGSGKWRVLLKTAPRFSNTDSRGGSHGGTPTGGGRGGGGGDGEDSDEGFCSDSSPSGPPYRAAPVSPGPGCEQGAPRELSVDPGSLVPIRRAHTMPILIGEPFKVTAGRGSGRRGELEAACWLQNVEHQLLGRHGQVRIMPQAQLSLWAHGVNHGIVVNIGQLQTIALPVVRGEIVASAACRTSIGSAGLTQLMMHKVQSLLNRTSESIMTWCRDVKEAHCYVAPPPPHGIRLPDWLAKGGAATLQGVTVPVPVRGGATLELVKELVLVPEAFFDHGCQLHGNGATLPELIVACAEQVLSRESCDEEGVRDLLRNVVLVGGAADLPGMRPRTEHEVRALLRSRASERLRGCLQSPDDAFVLNPPLGNHGPLASPRFVPFIGGCVKAASASFFPSGQNGEPGSVDTQAAESRANLKRRLGAMMPWVRQRMFNLNPAIFRTGGGGGEDDIAWDASTWPLLAGEMHSDEDDDDDDEEEEGEADEDDGMSEGEVRASPNAAASSAGPARTQATSAGDDARRHEPQVEPAPAQGGRSPAQGESHLRGCRPQ